ncbi:MAG: metallophosphoesterase family protein [Fibrobacteres bacterium]|nr:metallophosphoesterase family protein [Fibrobacterota bacterium]
MLIGIVSDTHRNKGLHTEVLNAFSEAGVDRVYHLGDDYADSELEIEYGFDVVRIPGLYCPEYKNREIEKVAYDTVQGIRMVMSHDLQDIPESDLRCHDIILHGHTHKMEIRVENGRIYMNPGHLKNTVDKGRAATYGMIDVDMGVINTKIFEVSGKAALEVSFKKEDTGLYKI